MRPAHPSALTALLLCAASLPAQQKVPQPVVHHLRGDDAELTYVVHEPSLPGPDGFRPLVLLLGDAVDPGTPRTRSTCARLVTALVADGFVVVRPQGLALEEFGRFERGEEGPKLLLRLPAALRQQLRIAQGGIHLVAHAATGGVPLGAVEKAARRFWIGAGLRLALERPWEFQSLTILGVAPLAPDGRVSRLRNRSVHWFAPPGDEDGAALVEQFARYGVRAGGLPLPAVAELPAAVLQHLRALRAERAHSGVAAECAHALDRFHDAAARGDEETYFALLPDDAVYLGTDATERWTGAEFKGFALPWFQRESAWIYVPVARHVTMLSDDLAAFDELLDNEAYGECRGSGVLERRDGRWVVRRYDLSVPMPNALARRFVQRIREFAAGAAPRRTTIVLVRHAEKATDGSRDPELTAEGKARAKRLAHVLADLPVTAVFATEYRRTQATVAPLARAKFRGRRTVPAADIGGLARTLRSEFAGGAVVVAGHSNTIPALLRELGVQGDFPIADDDYDDLFVVTVDDDGARLLHLHY